MFIPIKSKYSKKCVISFFKKRFLRFCSIAKITNGKKKLLYSVLCRWFQLSLWRFKTLPKPAYSKDIQRVNKVTLKVTINVSNSYLHSMRSDCREPSFSGTGYSFKALLDFELLRYPESDKYLIIRFQNRFRIPETW